MTTPAPAPDALAARTRRAVLAAALLLYAVLLVRHAWLCDDSFITFRTVRNFTHGLGLTWNVGFRVQAYTHPLWMLLVSALYWITREIFVSVIVFSCLVSLAAVALLVFPVAESTAAGLLAISLLVSSKAFMDYSTSGLENPLVHLLYVAFLGFALGPLRLRRWSDELRRAVWPMALLAGLLAITRLDTVLLTGPVLLWRAYPHWRERRLWAGLAVGFAPLFLWELFSIVYYGFPFPNTYYAKLAAGIPAWALARQGMGYCLSVLNQDPITVLTLGGGLVMPFLLGARRLWPVAAGLLLYSLYVVRAGGDFMLGRFFAAPFVGAVVVLVTGLRPLLAERGVALFAPAALVLALGVTITPRPTLKSDGSYALPSPNGEHPFDDRGISDERAYYYPNMGLLHVARDKNMPSDQRVIEGQALQPGKVSRRWAAGTIGWGAPPRAIILDELALSDPLLARLPAIRNKWRIGHLARRVPDGYVATLETGKNQLADKGLAQIWDRLSLVVTGPLWSWSRFQAIAWLNSGRYRPLIDVERYAKP